MAGSASLGGIAPSNNQSGQFQGTRHIPGSRGGGLCHNHLAV